MTTVDHIHIGNYENLRMSRRALRASRARVSHCPLSLIGQPLVETFYRITTLLSFGAKNVLEKPTENEN